MSKRMDPAQGTIFVVDCDPKAQAAYGALSASMVIRCELFSSAREFLDYYHPGLAGCVLIDMRLDGNAAGLQLQEQLASMGSMLPVILITADADVPSIVRGMKNGAMAIFQKPCPDNELAEAIRAGLKLNACSRESFMSRENVRRCLDALTPRELDIMDLILAGVPNKRISHLMDISPRTVDRVRAGLFRKMQVKSAVELANNVAKHGRRDIHQISVHLQ
jgi:FixJ family two-component response regulator